MTLVQTTDLHLAFGADPVFNGINLSIEIGERISLVGRNGTGKSCLMKVLSGVLEPDSGTIVRGKETRVAYLPQDVPNHVSGSVYQVALAGLGSAGQLLAEYQELTHDMSHTDNPAALKRLQQLQDQLDGSNGWDIHRHIETQLKRLNLPFGTQFETLSGGLKRQVLMVQAMASQPNLLLLDEPTNHLDIQAIGWLEQYLLSFEGSVLFVTHDRMFLRRLATRIIDLDRGKLLSFPCTYNQYLDRKQQALDAEEAEWDRADKKLAAEEVWIRKGIKARRTRNEGRVRALKRLREERRARRERTGQANIAVQQAEKSGKRVVEAEKITFGWENHPIVKNFSVDIIRGDRLGIIGPNGCGKTTLIKLLLGELEPNSGTVQLGTKLETVYFDQLRDQLDPEKTVQANLADGHDTVIINGQPKHTIGYLQDFLFTPERARTPVKVLSGGERNRLLLAKLFIQPANLLVMDEPTNDLDAETLEVLESVVLGFNGTLIVVSHDREFLNNVVTSTVVFDDDGVVRNYAGGYDDWQQQRAKFNKQHNAEIIEDKPKLKSPKSTARPKKLGYMEGRELEALPGQIEALEAEQAALHAKIAEPGFYQEVGEKITEVTSRLDAIEQALSLLYDRWDELETKANASR